MNLTSLTHRGEMDGYKILVGTWFMIEKKIYSIKDTVFIVFCLQLFNLWVSPDMQTWEQTLFWDH